MKDIHINVSTETTDPNWQIKTKKLIVSADPNKSSIRVQEFEELEILNMFYRHVTTEITQVTIYNDTKVSSNFYYFWIQNLAAVASFYQNVDINIQHMKFYFGDLINFGGSAGNSFLRIRYRTRLLK